MGFFNLQKSTCNCEINILSQYKEIFMKKVLVTLLLASAGTVFAQSVTIDGQNSKPNAGGNESNQLTLAVKAPVTKLLSIDGGISNQITDNTYKQTTRYEAGLTAQAPVAGPVDLYGRGAIGQKSISGAEGFAYWSTEVGAIWHTPLAGLDAKVGYRYREAFAGESKLDTTNTFRYALSYAVTKSDTLGVRYDVVNGDGANKTTGLFYSRKF